jgi:hypothetical protein
MTSDESECRSAKIMILDADGAMHIPANLLVSSCVPAIATWSLVVTGTVDGKA